jgi:hypothetical protein
MAENLLITHEPQSAAPRLRLHARQYEVFFCPRRFRVVVAGRRAGKTELALAEMLRASTVPNSLIWFVAPNRNLAKEIIWDRLKSLTRPLWAEQPLEGPLRINLKNGSSIIVKGGFKPENLRGTGVDFVVLDETADLKPDAWNYSIRPALADRRGRAMIFGSPRGRNHLYDHFEFAKIDPDEWGSFHFTTAQSGMVQAIELDSVCRQMSGNAFRQEFDAEFTSIGNYPVYLSFSREANVREVRFEVSSPLIWSLDFNVDPMCMLLMQRIGDIIYVLEEIEVRSDHCTTEMACQRFVERTAPYVKLVGSYSGALEVHLYGDSSGHQRRTAAADTDWTIIRNHFRTFHRGSIDLFCHFTSVNPFIRDRINCVNARLRNAREEAQLFISPGCKELIRDLEEVCYKIDAAGAPTNDIDKSDRNRTHMSDALGYYISQVFPLRGLNKLYP